MGKGSSILSKYPKGRGCFMEASLGELAGYRLEKAKEMLLASESNLKIGQYKIIVVSRKEKGYGKEDWYWESRF